MSESIPVADGSEIRADVGAQAHELGRWQVLMRDNPSHSIWYAERFRKMVREGRDLYGEARLVDAMALRASRILDAGCGPARFSAYLQEAGHDVVGVDIDPYLIEVAKREHPGPQYLVADLVDLDLPAQGIEEGFDVIVCAGNVMTFLAESTRARALARMKAHLNPGGRILVGFGTTRGYSTEAFAADAQSAGLHIDNAFASWGLLPLRPDSDFLVAILSA